MVDLIRNAMSSMGLAGRGETTTIGGSAPHPLIGQLIQVGSRHLRIRHLIAEGGFATVFAADDKEGEWYAVKRQLANDHEARNAIVKEITFLRQLKDSTSIITFLDAAQHEDTDRRSPAEFLIVTELCSGGSVVNLLTQTQLTPRQVVQIFHSTCMAVKSMHELPTPITHRDLKVENLLFDRNGVTKLCDFGSATVDVAQPTEDWNMSMRTRLEEEAARHTTPMYRAPEILDTYQNYPVGPQQDIWALGCILFYLCYRTHPFEDSAKLRIINAKYTIPTNQPDYDIFRSLIEMCLQIDPRKRPRVGTIVEHVRRIAAHLQADLRAGVDGVNTDLLTRNLGHRPWNGPSAAPPPQGGAPQRPPPPRSSDQATEIAKAAKETFGAFKAQGISVFNKLKQDFYSAPTTQTPIGPPLLIPLAEKILVSPLNDVSDALFEQLDESLLQAVRSGPRPARNVVVMSLSKRPDSRLDGFVNFFLPPLSSRTPPTFDHVLELCKRVDDFSRNFDRVILRGSDTEVQLAFASLLLFLRLVQRPLEALDQFERRYRATEMPPSHHLLLDHLRTFSLPSIERAPRVSSRIVHVTALQLFNSPRMNREGSGCRPFVEIFQEHRRVWTMEENYERLGFFGANHEGPFEIPLNAFGLSREVAIVISHARQGAISMKKIPICTIPFDTRFHTGSAREVDFPSSACNIAAESAPTAARFR